MRKNESKQPRWQHRKRKVRLVAKRMLKRKKRKRRRKSLSCQPRKTWTFIYLKNSLKLSKKK